MKLAVAFNDNIFSHQAELLSAKLDLPLIELTQGNFLGECFDHLLLFAGEGLGLLVVGSGSQGAVRVDFCSPRLRHRRRGGHNEMLGRACGVKAAFRPRIVDATAGLGVDSYVLADLGCEVMLIERSPIVAALLEDGFERAELTGVETTQRMTLYSADSLEYLAGLCEAEVDVVYLDPMFPSRGKSAKVKKEMQAFQQLVGEGDSGSELLDQSRRVAKYRVVVKRPVKAPSLGEKQPSFDLRGKSIRYDVYTNQKLP